MYFLHDFSLVAQGNARGQNCADRFLLPFGQPTYQISRKTVHPTKTKSGQINL